MFVNQANLRGLNVTFSTAYNKAFDGVKTNYEKIATTVPVQRQRPTINGSVSCHR